MSPTKWARLTQEGRSMDNPKVDELREEQQAFTGSHKDNTERSRSWWYLEGMCDALRKMPIWDRWDKYKTEEPHNYEAYMQGRADVEGERVLP